MKKTSSQLIKEAIEIERPKIAAAEKKRTLALLQSLARAYWVERNVKAQEGVLEAIKTIERYI